MDILRALDAVVLVWRLLFGPATPSDDEAVEMAPPPVEAIEALERERRATEIPSKP